MTECTGARYNQRQRKTKLEKLIELRQHYKQRADAKSPTGAPRDQWLLWIAWRNARRDMFDKLIREAMETKRTNQRSKANDRKRDRGASCRGK